MKKTIISALAVLCLSCGNDNTSSEVDTLQNEVNELKNKNTQLEEEKQQQIDLQAAEEKRKKDKETQDKKDLIIQQIWNGEGIVMNVTHDNIGMGGINNAILTLENALVGISFQYITIAYSVFLENGQLYKSDRYTFTNLKPGDTRTRALFNTGNRGTTFKVQVIEMQSAWLTNNKKLNYYSY